MSRRNIHIRGRFTDAQHNLFMSGLKFTDSSGRLLHTYRPLVLGDATTPTARGRQVKPGTTIRFRDVRPMELPKSYTGTGIRNGRGGSLRTRDSWGLYRVVNEGTVQPLTPQQFHQQLVMLPHLLTVSAENWTVVIAQRAKKVFNESFTLKKFNSSGARRWKRISAWTKQKRKRKGTWYGAGGLLAETGAMRKSLKVIVASGRGASVISTSPYSGYHNSPRKGETWGNGWGGRWSPPKPNNEPRQFMGHSTKIAEFINQYQHKYLFDNVFRRVYKSK